MVKNEVLGRIGNFGGYGSICLGLEINLAGSAEFLPPNFRNQNFTHHQHYPPNLYHVYSNNITIPTTIPNFNNRGSLTTKGL